MKYIYGILLSIANFCKRFYYVNKTIFIKIVSLYSWLFFSKEHTSFSFKLSEKNKLFFLQNLHNDFGINRNHVSDIINFSDKIKLKKPFFSSINPKTVDVNFKVNFDYTILVLTFLKNTETNFIYEFGFNQGRLALLLNKYQKYEKDIKFKYYGVDINERKGGLYQSQNNLDTEYINLHFVDLNYFLKKHFDYDKFSKSILISSTHEKTSENSLFNYLSENNTYPEIIISDNIREDSAYVNFIKKNNIYSSSIYCFEDLSQNHQPLYIGISKKLSQTTSSE